MGLVPGGLRPRPVAVIFQASAMPKPKESRAAEAVYWVLAVATIAVLFSKLYPL